MAYIARMTITALKAEANGQKHFGESTECVAAVKHFCNAPQTSRWRKGRQVKGRTDIRAGTAIATFTAPNNGYRGHAAIYVGQNSTELQVLDQWKTKKFSPRPIRFNNAENGVSNDGDQFYVVD